MANFEGQLVSAVLLVYWPWRPTSKTISFLLTCIFTDSTERSFEMVTFTACFQPKYALQPPGQEPSVLQVKQVICSCSWTCMDITWTWMWPMSTLGFHGTGIAWNYLPSWNSRAVMCIFKMSVLRRLESSFYIKQLYMKWVFSSTVPPPSPAGCEQTWHSRSGPSLRMGWTCSGRMWGKWRLQTPCGNNEKQ